MLNLDYEEKIKTAKSSDVSTRQLKRSFLLGDEDVKFVNFRNYVDDMTKDKILTLYGNWSELTTPILTQNMLSTLTNTFKTDMCRYHELINILLHKDVSENQY